MNKIIETIIIKTTEKLWNLLKDRKFKFFCLPCISVILSCLVLIYVLAQPIYPDIAWNQNRKEIDKMIELEVALCNNTENYFGFLRVDEYKNEIQAQSIFGVIPNSPFKKNVINILMLPQNKETFYGGKIVRGDQYMYDLYKNIGDLQIIGFIVQKDLKKDYVNAIVSEDVMKSLIEKKTFQASNFFRYEKDNSLYTVQIKLPFMYSIIQNLKSQKLTVVWTVGILSSEFIYMIWHSYEDDFICFQNSTINDIHNNLLLTAKTIKERLKITFWRSTIYSFKYFIHKLYQSET